MSDLVAMFLVGYYMVFASYNGKDSLSSPTFLGGVILLILAITGFSVARFTGLR